MFPGARIGVEREGVALVPRRGGAVRPLIVVAALLALAGPAAAVCKAALQARAVDYLADENAHHQLRGELGVTVPTAPEHITIYAAGGHLSTTRTSIVATRGSDGRWHTDAVGRSKIWVEGAAPSDRKRPVSRVLFRSA